MPPSPYRRRFARPQQSATDPRVEQTRKRLLARRSVPLPYQDTNWGNLWDDVTPGRAATLRNLRDDAVETVLDTVPFVPSEAFHRFKNRLRAYRAEGPEITLPVPLLQNPYKGRQSRTGDE